MAHVNNDENFDDYGNIDNCNGGDGDGNHSPRPSYPKYQHKWVLYLTYDRKCRLPFGSI